MGFQLVAVARYVTDPSVAAEEREWLKVAGGSKAHLLEAKSPRGFPHLQGGTLCGTFLFFLVLWYFFK